MISKIALSIADFYAKAGAYEREKIPSYAYGFELLISTVLNGLAMLFISIYMGAVLGGVLFALAFIPLRTCAGGYHTKSHFACFFTSNLMFLLFMVMLKYVTADFAYEYSILAVIVSSFIIWELSPVEPVNKPASRQKKERLRERSIAIATVNMALVLLFWFTPQLPMRFLAYYASGAFCASLSLVAARKQYAN